MLRSTNPRARSYDPPPRLLRSRICEQRQPREPNEEQVSRSTLGKPKRRAERVALRSRQTLEPRKQRHQQLVQPSEAQLHLRLDADHMRHLHIASRRDHVIRQDALADPRFTPQDDRATQSLTRRGEQAITACFSTLRLSSIVRAS